VHRVSRIVDGLGVALLGVASIAILVGVLAGTADVAGTYLFLSPVHGATELTTELVVAIVFLSLAHVQRRRGHIRVELLYTHLGPRTQAVLDALGAAIALVFFGLLLWQGYVAALFSWQIQESTLSVVRIPIYPAKFSILVGVGVLMARLVIDLVASVRAALDATPRRT